MSKRYICTVSLTHGCCISYQKWKGQSYDCHLKITCFADQTEAYDSQKRTVREFDIIEVDGSCLHLTKKLILVGVTH